MSDAAGDINRAVAKLHERYGPVFAFGFGPLRFVWLVGAEANRFVLEDAAADLTLGRAYGFLRTIGGDSALITSDEPDHRRRRRLVQPAFHRAKLERLDTLIAARLEDLFAGFQDRTVDIYTELKQHLLSLICEILLGERVRHSPLTADIAHMMAFANLPMPAQLFKVPLPGTPWANFTAARRRADRALYSEIERRTAGLTSLDELEPGELEPGEDVLGLLLAAKDESGRGLSAREVRDQAISLVSAGFETTSAALTWAVYAVLESATLQRDLRDTLASADEPPLLQHIVKETLRLYPPAPIGLRQAARDLTYDGYPIPEGHFVAFSIYATHRSEDYFENAQAFRPERWETLKPAPYSYLPFGAGTRYCIGAGLATRIVTLALKLLFRSYRVAPAWSAPVQEAGNTLHPKGGLKVTITRRR